MVAGSIRAENYDLDSVAASLGTVKAYRARCTPTTDSTTLKLSSDVSNCKLGKTPFLTYWLDCVLRQPSLV